MQLIAPETTQWNHQLNNLELTSGDEIAYEHVEEEKLYYIDTSEF